MPYAQLDRAAVHMKPLAERTNKKRIERDHVPLDFVPRDLDAAARRLIDQTAKRIVAARRTHKPVMLAFGAHTIKNGLALVLIDLIEHGWVTHLATNGAGIIHDWEFAFQGESSEDVEANVARGEFGNWQETGFNINLAINVGAYEGRGYGESVGAFIEREGLNVPSREQLESEVARDIRTNPSQAAASADLLDVVRRFDLQPGFYGVAHPFKSYSAQAAAFRLGVPFTDHPMIGHDIIYNHPMNHGGLLGRAALRDFLTFAESVSRIDGGVYLSLGSAVMSPMVFEKSLSMAQNLSLQRGARIENHFILVVDMANSNWDWRRGEPPETAPEYYLRYNKTFSRMGGEMHYLTADNCDFLAALRHALHGLTV